MSASPSARTRRSSSGPEIYEIDPHKCTECVGHFDEPQCVQVCPVACIPVNPAHVESRETLWQKYQRLTAQARQAAAGRRSRQSPRPLRRWRLPACSLRRLGFFAFGFFVAGLAGRDRREVRPACLRPSCFGPLVRLASLRRRLGVAGM